MNAFGLDARIRHQLNRSIGKPIEPVVAMQKLSKERLEIATIAFEGLLRTFNSCSNEIAKGLTGIKEVHVYLKKQRFECKVKSNTVAQSQIEQIGGYALVRNRFSMRGFSWPAIICLETFGHGLFANRDQARDPMMASTETMLHKDTDPNKQLADVFGIVADTIGQLVTIQLTFNTL